MSTILKAKNPIMEGFYPDPSICAVGEDFYLCNSTFSYFPGLPIMHSKDLVHWEQIGNVLERESQIPLKNADHSQGLFAPTIRYNNGIFYVICTNVTHGGNFICTSKSPEGPWSEPHILPDADGIDPSLFFDTDGKCYFIGTHPNPDGTRYDGDWFIYISELDINEFKLVGEKKNVWNGALKNCIWPEGPHLYKIGDYYYIMHAEGGTGPEHSVMICRSKNVWGPYENYAKNPVLTHRHLGNDYPVKYVGHADLFKTVNDEWFMSMLAVRPLNRYTTMGRETFLAKVIWEDGWPVVNPGIGKLEEFVEINLPEWNPLEDVNSYTNRSSCKNTIPGTDKSYDFTKIKKLGDEFLFLRNISDDLYRLDSNGLSLKIGRLDIKAVDSPSYVSVRQQHHYFTAGVVLDVENLKKDESAGIVLMQNNLYNLRAEVINEECVMILCEKGNDKIIGKCLLKEATNNNLINLSIIVDGLITKVKAGDNILGEASVASLSTEVAGGFVGCTVGMYASSNGNENDTYVTFKKFTYISKK